VDRAGLEAAACACYAVIRDEFARMLDGHEVAGALDDLRLSEGGTSIVGDGTPMAARDETEGERETAP
jgi:hypothetical protein